MATELIQDYWLNHRPNTRSARMWIRTAGSGWQIVHDLPSDKAAFICELLLNEKPVFWDAGNQVVYTR